jgi:hypothetical protein
VSFRQLIAKVEQAEQALEARERAAAADWRQLKSSWREGWTPMRIVLAGFASGYAVGRARPLRHVTGGGVLQLLTAVAGLFAGGSAQVAAGEAEEAAESAQQTAAAVDPAAVPAPDVPVDA